MKEKIRKLLALAADPGAAPQEAETAARQAAALMAKHDIDLADLEEAELKAQWDLIRGEAVGCRPGKRNAKEVPAWIGIIAWGVKCYTRTRCVSGRGVVYFMGPREDVELAQWLQGILVKAAYAAGSGPAFYNGFASAIQKRLKAMVEQREQVEDGMSSTALVKVQDARQRVMDDAYGFESSGRRSRHVQSAQGFAAGMAASIPQGRPVSQSFLRLK